MKNKKIYVILAAVVALVVVVSILLGVVLGSGLSVVQLIDTSVFASSSDEDWDVITEGEITLTSGDMQLIFDVSTTHFTVKNNATGVSVNSISDVDTEQLLANEIPEVSSELIIEYNDTKWLSNKLYSSKNSVDFNTVQVKTDGNAIRVYYTLRKSSFKVFAPEFVRASVFEEQLEPNISKRLARTFKQWYDLYSSSKPDQEGYSEMLSKYPALKDEDLYILKENDNIKESVYEDITNVMIAGNYTEEDFLADAAELGITVKESDMAVGFIVPIEYKLTEDGFTAQILVDKFVSESTKFTPTKISFLPTFGAQAVNTDGYLFVPDGSGAIIDVDEKPGKVFETQIYGVNSTIKSQFTDVLQQQAHLPVFGYNRGNDGFFAVITGAAEEAYVYANVLGDINKSTNVYAEFNLFNSEKIQDVSSGQSTAYYIYSKEAIKVLPKIRYYILDSENNSYSSMAAIYRNYLIETETLKDRLEETDNIPFYMDLTGYFETDETMIGIPYVKQNVISTISGATEAVNTLSKLGVKDINIRFKYYGNGGVFHYLNDGFDLYSGVGSVEQLKNLAALLKNQNGTLYLEQDLGVVYNDKLLDSFIRQTHAAQTLTRIAAIDGDFNIVTRDTDDVYYKHYLISPIYFTDLITRFTKSLTKEVGTVDNIGYSWASYGNRLWADYNDVMEVDRTISTLYSAQAINVAKQTFSDIITDGGNAYSIKDVSTILNMPISDSLFDAISYKVPFMQMVLHGYKDYAAAPFNIAAGNAQNRLASIESGANVYYSCYTESDEIIKRVENRTYQYPTGISGIYERIAADYTEFNSIFADLRTQLIVEHERLERDVFCTTYEDGTKIVVNYNVYDCTAYGKTVPAGDYIVIKDNGGAN